MKKGEKLAIGLVLGTLAVILIAVVYLESQVQKGSPEKKLAGLIGKDLGKASMGPGVWVIPKNINPDALPEPDGKGAKILNLYCVQCHDLPLPAMHTPSEWKDVLNRMHKQMQDRRGGMLLQILMPPEKDWNTLQAYLTKYAQQPMDTAQFSDLDTPAGRTFQSTCSQCHAAPDPAQHTAREWPRVVVRMKFNMTAAGKNAPDDSTIDLIIGFLQKHSKGKHQGE
jgi:cytochrome c5